MKRMNLGCGSVQPEGWVNADFDLHYFEVEDETHHWLNVISPSCPSLIKVRGWTGTFDYIVSNHMLSDIGHNDLVPALSNVRSMLRDGGVLRILVPDIAKAFAAWQRHNEGWFPQDERTGGLDAKFCTFVTWFGESRSVFTYGYLRHLLESVGFTVSLALNCGERWFDGVEGITDLDDRCTEALIVEAQT